MLILELFTRFLLAKLYSDELSTKTSIDALQQALHHPPKGLDDIYESILERIKSQPEDYSGLAGLVLMWICAVRKPPTLLFLQHALAVKAGSKSLNEESFEDPELMVDISAGFVELTDNDSRLQLVRK